MKRVALLMMLCAISGCAAVQKPVKNEVAPKLAIKPPNISPVRLRTLEFYVLTESNFDAFSQKVSQEPYYAVSVEGYTILAENIQELRRYIRELQAVVLFYKDIYSDESP